MNPCRARSEAAARVPRLAGWFVAIMVAIAAFLWVWIEGVGLRDFGGLSRDEAISEAAVAGGWRWPGTTVRVRNETDDRAVVERRWLFMTETTSDIVRMRDGWYDGGSPKAGLGEGIQVLLACLVVPAALGFLTRTLLK